jgi:hypothetical protein
MGLLDDAIREHLELKRRTGADAEAVAREEHAAFGPGGDEPISEPVGEEPAPGAPVFDGGLYDDEDAEVYDDEPEDLAVEPSYSAPPPPPPPPPLPPRPPVGPARTPPRPPARTGPPPPPSGPPTEEFRLPPAEADPDNVLEQTPDFLQETPEHDRLWFEQAPPQEFDFDK